MSPTSIYLLLALCSATPLATGVRPFALFNGRATFTAPRSWGAIQAPASDTLEEVLFCIPNPISEGTPDAANVLVQIRPAPKVPNFRTYTDSLFAIVTAGEGHLVLTDTTDADHVRTIFWRGQQGATPYGIADIFGVTRGLAIYVRTALPLLKRMPADWLPRVTRELNGFLGSFAVDGATLLPRIQAVADSLR